MSLSIEEAIKAVMQESEEKDISGYAEENEGESLSEPVKTTPSARKKVSEKRKRKRSPHVEALTTYRPVLNLSTRTMCMLKLYCIKNGLTETEAVVMFIEKELEKSFDNIGSLGSFLGTK